MSQVQGRGMVLEFPSNAFGAVLRVLRKIHLA